MAIRNTSISAPCSQESALISTLASYAPEGLMRIVELGQSTTRPDIYFDVAELDEIVEGKNIARHADVLGDGTYLSDFFQLWSGGEISRMR